MGKPPFIMSTMYKTIFDDTKTKIRSLVFIMILHSDMNQVILQVNKISIQRKKCALACRSYPQEIEENRKYIFIDIWSKESDKETEAILCTKGEQKNYSNSLQQ